MEPNKEANKPRINYRYYELPEGELVQAITGEDWVCTYGTYAEDVHFHNVMEIGICRWALTSRTRWTASNSRALPGIL